jgi:hypothetical protein
LCCFEKYSLNIWKLQKFLNLVNHDISKYFSFLVISIGLTCLTAPLFCQRFLPPSLFFFLSINSVFKADLKSFFFFNYCAGEYIMSFTKFLQYIKYIIFEFIPAIIFLYPFSWIFFLKTILRNGITSNPSKLKYSF